MPKECWLLAQAEKEEL